jgi:hypothetical protein
MFSSNATMKDSRKIEVLHRIQYELGRSKQPTPRDAGLTETEFQEMADGKLFQLEKLEDSGPVLDNYVITEVLYDGLQLLSKKPSPIEPLQRIQSQSPAVSPAAAIGKGAGKLFWAILSAVLASLASILVTHWLDVHKK